MAANMSTDGEVANALVCKTSIHGFKSHSVLHKINSLAPFGNSLIPPNTTLIELVRFARVFLCLETTSERYQHGSIRRVKRAKGFAWEFRYYVRDGSKRSLKLQTFDSSIPENVDMIAVTMGCLGLRVSEALGLKWSDIDWELQTVTIRRSAYRGAIDETKTTSSKAKLPLHPVLAELLVVWKTKGASEWNFANPSPDMPYQSPSMQQRWVRPAGEAIGIKGLGFHSLRHSYRSWLDSAGIAPGVTEDLMRHSAISTTFNVYGRALSLEKREANSKVIEMLFPTPVPSLPPTTQ
jgi:integrase